MIILSQDGKTMWNDSYLVNIQLFTEKEYQEEERLISKDGSIDIVVNYYPGIGAIKANFQIGDSCSEVKLFEGDATSAETIFNQLIDGISNGKNLFKIPEVKPSDCITIPRYHKDVKLKRYVELDSWKKYEKKHPITNLVRQIVRVSTSE